MFTEPVFVFDQIEDGPVVPVVDQVVVVNGTCVV